MVGFTGRHELNDFIYEQDNGLIVDGFRIERVTEDKLQLFPTYPAFSLEQVWQSPKTPILWGSPIVHPTSFVSYGAVLGKGVIVGPGCLVPEGVELRDGVRLCGGSRLRRNQVVGDFKIVRWGD